MVPCKASRMFCYPYDNQVADVINTWMGLSAVSDALSSKKLILAFFFFQTLFHNKSRNASDMLGRGLIIHRPIWEACGCSTRLWLCFTALPKTDDIWGNYLQILQQHLKTSARMSMRLSPKLCQTGWRKTTQVTGMGVTKAWSQPNWKVCTQSYCVWVRTPIHTWLLQRKRANISWINCEKLVEGNWTTWLKISNLKPLLIFEAL